MSCITKINKRTLERIEEAVDWLSYPVRISTDEAGTIYVILSVRMGDPAHYSLHSDRREDPVVEFAGMLAPNAESVSITFKKSNVIDEVKIESRDDCLVIYNKEGATPSLDICTLMEALRVDESTAYRAFRRIAQKQMKQICLTRPREEWMLSQNRA